MRAFNSRILSSVYKGKYFITSEKMDMNHPRLFTIREVKPNGNIHTIGDFEQFSTERKAIKYIETKL
jgi:hypothetical protein